MATQNSTTSPDTPVSVKLTIAGSEEHRKFRLTLKDLGATTLPEKLRQLLAVESTKNTVFERYSDSSASYVVLDSNNTAVYKQLYRAAKAKGKLRLRVNIIDKSHVAINESPAPVPSETPFLPTERLPCRSYMQPYVSDSGADQSPSSRISMLEDFKTLSAAPSTITLTPFTKSSIEPQKEPPSYFWPVSGSDNFSDATKSRFENKGTPICQTKEPQNKPRAHDEAPLPGFFDFNDEQFVAPPRSCPARSSFYARDAARASNLAKLAEVQHKHVTDRQSAKLNGQSNFVIQCNKCDSHIPNAHWHCSICDAGDYDVCTDCVQKGCLCEDDQHWLIKRFFKDGKIITSTTETMAPKKPSRTEEKKDIPGAFNPEIKTEAVAHPERTCNACVQVFPEPQFITCTVCDDFDLCMLCHTTGKHGHHPGHRFEPAVKENKVEGLAQQLLAPGRDYHHFAICDGCDKTIIGVRHKCLNCPDWDFCSDCAPKASQIHPGHRFAQLYDPIQTQFQPTQVHHGICCDGPLCENKRSYIVGDRYKCAVCHDTDFCARCEAVPTFKHNRTHPLLKFKTPVRNVSVSTYGEKANGDSMRPMGDLPRPTSSKSTETLPTAQSANAATQVQHEAEVKLPMDSPKSEEKPVVTSEPAIESAPLKAQFEVDTILDGTVLPPGTKFTQTWTLSNPGPRTWPVGCSVCFVGGDSMFDVDPNHPSSIGQLNKALSTNTIDREAKKGEEIDFSVTMRTQEREGKAISYWRLKTADGTPFGHRLWCDVNVRKEVPSNAIKEENTESDVPKAEPQSPADQQEEEPKSSQMIFPKLEKESPVSSQHEAEVTSAPPAVTAATLSPAEQDLLEDVESLELDDNEDESSEEGFLTDEEYELIASGDEMEVAKNGKK